MKKGWEGGGEALHVARSPSRKHAHKRVSMYLKRYAPTHDDMRLFPDPTPAGGNPNPIVAVADKFATGEAVVTTAVAGA